MNEEQLRFVLEKEAWLKDDLDKGKIPYSSTMMKLIEIIWDLDRTISNIESYAEDSRFD